MKALTVVLIVIAGLALVLGAYFFSINSKEISLRNTIKGKQLDNKSEFDSMWKQISQVAEVTQDQRDTLLKIFVEHAKARTGSGSDGSVMKWVQESVPNVTTMHQSLANTIVSVRNSYTMRQKELIGLKVEHDNLIDTPPGGWFLYVLGRQKIDIVIVTSSRSEKAFETGKDDDVQLFKK